MANIQECLDHRFLLRQTPRTERKGKTHNVPKLNLHYI